MEEKKKYNGQVEQVKHKKKLPAKRMASKKSTGKLGTAIEVVRLLLSALQSYQQAKPHINNIRRKKKK